MPDLDSLSLHRTPSPQRPLLGMTVLAVEDSRYASEALRLMCLRSGARIRRADCLTSARRHLTVYRPSMVIVDPGLPDGSGIDLIAELARAVPRVGIILASSGDPAARGPALAAGADGFLDKPVENLGRFQSEILRHLPAEHCPPGPYALSEEILTPDSLAYCDDLEHIRSVLGQAQDAETRIYAARFLHGIARACGDRALAEAAAPLGRPAGAMAVAHVLGLIDTRLDARAVM